MPPGNRTPPTPARGWRGRRIGALGGMTECRREIEPDPSSPEVVWFGNRPTMENRAGIADRYRVVGPVSSKLLDAGHHPPGGQRPPGRKRSELVMSGGKDLD